MTDAPQVFDRRLIGRRLQRARRAGDGGADFLLRAAVDDLADRLQAVQRRFDSAADIGTPLPLLARTLRDRFVIDRVVYLAHGSDLPEAAIPTVVGDEQALPFGPGHFDLVVSALALQTTNDLPGALLQIRRSLKPDGLFLAALFGGETLVELRESFTQAELEQTGGAAPRVAPFAEVRALGALLQRAGFALPVADQDRLTVRYDTMFDVIRDLRAMGATNPLVERDRRPLRRAVLMRAAAIYVERFADPDGRVRATFDIVSLSGWAPHDSQQKPLAPGSARVRLADALGTTEQPAGDKAKR